MTTAGEGSTPTALDLLFGRGADAAETLAGAGAGLGTSRSVL